jgi:hypothetical protein
MDRNLSFMLALCACITGAAAQPRDASVFAHTYGNLPVVKAYHLSAEQEVGFSNADNHRSCFWLAWEFPSANPLDSLMIQGDSSHSAWGPVETPDDATITLKLAWGTAGLYVLFEVVDDTSFSYASATDYMNDVLELFLDPHSGRQLYSADTHYFPDVDISQLTETYDHFQVRLGGNEPVEQFSLNWWNPSVVGKGCTQPAQCVLYQRNLTFPEADQTWGMKIEIIPPRGDETNIPRQEWLIPWALYGQPPGNGTPPAEGDRLAMCFGYNDRDNAMEPSASAIRWRNAADPYTTATDPATDHTTTVDSWGEIEFAGDLLTMTSLTQCEIECACSMCCSCVDNAQEPLHPIHRIEQPKPLRTEYFTLSGRRVTDPHAVPLYSALLKRSVLVNGVANVKKIVQGIKNNAPAKKMVKYGCY